MASAVARVKTYDLAVAIAPHLSMAPGLTWTVQGTPGDDCGVRLILRGGRNDGAAIWLHVDHKNRAEVAGIFPMLESGRMYSPPAREDYGRAGFDPTRPPAHLARAIEGRCLSTYLKAYERALAYAAEERLSRCAVRDAAERIAAVAGEEPRKQGSDGSVEIFPNFHGCYRITVRPSEGEARVAMKLEDLSPEQALSVLELLKGGPNP